MGLLSFISEKILPDSLKDNGFVKAIANIAEGLIDGVLLTNPAGWAILAGKAALWAQLDPKTDLGGALLGTMLSAGLGMVGKGVASGLISKGASSSSAIAQRASGIADNALNAASKIGERAASTVGGKLAGNGVWDKFVTSNAAQRAQDGLFHFNGLIEKYASKIAVPAVSMATTAAGGDGKPK